MDDLHTPSPPPLPPLPVDPTTVPLGPTNSTLAADSPAKLLNEETSLAVNNNNQLTVSLPSTQIVPTEPITHATSTYNYYGNAQKGIL
jgi:hypothetical protein